MEGIVNSGDKLSLLDLVHQVVFLVKNRQDYVSAARILRNHNISLEALTNQTFKLTSLEIGHLADSILRSK